MTYFNENFIQFFKDLAANNEREWFHANKKRYEKEVKIPFEKFVEDLIKAIHADDKTVDISQKKLFLESTGMFGFLRTKRPIKFKYLQLSLQEERRIKPPRVYIFKWDQNT